jgi:hypothetical protein
MAGQNGKIRVALSALADALRRAGLAADKNGANRT